MPVVFTSAVMQCPKCGIEEVEAVTDGEITNFLCHACWSCWHVEFGWV
jgi:transposase-like protein